MVKQVSNPVASGAPVNRVDDPVARVALQRLNEGWSVRNGTGGERFVTAKELQDPGTGSGLIARALAGVFQKESGADKGTVGKIIEGMVDAIMQSPLWQRLGARIEWLSRENNLSLQKIAALQVGITEERSIRQEGNAQVVSTLVGLKAEVEDNHAAILEEREVRASQNEASATRIDTLDSRIGGLTGEVGGVSATLQAFSTTQVNWNTATAQQLGTLQAGLAGNTAAIQSEASVRAERDGLLEAQYTVKVDVNGYVSGFGLASTARNSLPYSRFVVRADQFAIGSPSGPGINPQVPFIVNTTTDAQGNPPGVYIENAMIKDLSVDTLKIKGEAITISQYAYGQIVQEGGTLFDSNWVQTVSMPLYISGMPRGAVAGVIIMASNVLWEGKGKNGVFDVAIFCGESLVSHHSITLKESQEATVIAHTALQNGVHNISIRVRSGIGSAPQLAAVFSSLVVMGGKR